MESDSCYLCSHMQGYLGFLPRILAAARKPIANQSRCVVNVYLLPRVVVHPSTCWSSHPRRESLLGWSGWPPWLSARANSGEAIRAFLQPGLHCGTWLVDNHKNSKDSHPHVVNQMFIFEHLTGIKVITQLACCHNSNLSILVKPKPKTVRKFATE